MGDDLKTFLLNINSLHFQLERKFREVSNDVEMNREQFAVRVEINGVKVNSSPFPLQKQSSFPVFEIESENGNDLEFLLHYKSVRATLMAPLVEGILPATVHASLLFHCKQAPIRLLLTKPIS